MTLRGVVSCAGPVLSCLVLAACHSAPTRLYALYPVPSAAAVAAYAGPAVRIDTVHVPPNIDRIELVSDIAPGVSKISDLDHWSAPLGQMAKQTLSADMLVRLPAGRVIFPHLVKPDDAAGVTVDILDFKSGTQEASMEASWVLTTPEGTSHPITVRLTVDVAAAGSATMAQSLSVLLGQLADRIVAGLPATGLP